MRLAAGTIAAKRELPSARVVAESFAHHHPDIPFFVLLADEVEGCFAPGELPVQLVQLAELDIADRSDLCFRYEQQPLSYALTPFFLAELLDRGFDRVVFIKQESLVTDELAPFFDALSTFTILLTPHLLDPPTGPDAIARELEILRAGVFNVGLVGVGEGPSTGRFLAWWQDRVRAHCRYDVAAGVHYEQRWLDLAPAYFESLGFIRDPGYNVAHWNLPDRVVELTRDGRLVADGHRCRLFRFSGFDPDQPRVPTRYSPRLEMDAIGDAADVYARYRSALLRAGWALAREWPYAYARFEDGTPIPPIAREIFDALDDRARFGDPFAVGAGSYFEWLASRPARRSAVNRLWHAVHAKRPDLQAAFPNPLGRDARAFRAWTRSFGASEYNVPEPLVD